jgi:hypothetical protein
VEDDGQNTAPVDPKRDILFDSLLKLTGEKSANNGRAHSNQLQSETDTLGTYQSDKKSTTGATSTTSKPKAPPRRVPTVPFGTRLSSSTSTTLSSASSSTTESTSASEDEESSSKSSTTPRPRKKRQPPKKSSQKAWMGYVKKSKQYCIAI